MTIGLPESDVSLMWTCSGMSPVLNIRKLAQMLNVTQMFLIELVQVIRLVSYFRSIRNEN